ncbi:uncharacterized protein LOC108825280 [Raphanus sativus]|uniref:Uncharacterized protein LOC108825280 n=1 Tax=Raphanus sativus TaxID=3726 RepID=A0A9W3CHK4_RAPSA|nr:uncharacterized protein LOC108825280 [Raphanus sativus]
MHFIGYSEAAKDPEMQGMSSNSGTRKSNTLNQNMVASRPKKRKDSTFLQSPWHKVYLQASKLCHSISVSEQEWALATNTLCEKINPHEAIPPSKKRLVLSTTLMQQLLKPAPTCVFSDINASFNYEIILYLESRITLADACSLPCHLDFDNITNLSHFLMFLLPSLTSNRSSDQEKGYSTLAKSFVEKVQKLESDFQSLERTTSILDIILEIQDIERLSVINRLAKFHSRAKTITRSVPQRYVELQKPGELPEPLGPLQCLAL